MQLFQELVFAAITIRGIAELAGVSTGTVNGSRRQKCTSSTDFRHDDRERTYPACRLPHAIGGGQLIAIKLLPVTGLIAGIWIPGIALAANIGVIAYFLIPAVVHIRARFLGQAF